MISAESHINFLSNFFNLPNPDRKEPFICGGFDRPAPASIADGFPEEAMRDRKFENITIDTARARNLSLAGAYTELGIPVGWITRYKNPILSEKDCGFKQGMSLDMKFLKNSYDRLANTNLLNPNFNPDACPFYLGYHTNTNGMGFVVDLDFKENEKDATRTFLPWLEKNGIDPRALPAVLTPSGGLHLYFLPYDGLHTSTSNFAPDLWGKGVDPRGNGAYCMAAGSCFKTFEYNKIVFKQYTVINNAPLAPLPQCLIDVFESRLAKRGSTFAVPQSFSPSCGNSQLDIACRILAGKKEGERNTTLNKMSYAMGKIIRDGALEESDAREQLMRAAISAGLSESEVIKSMESGLRAGIASSDPYEPFESANDELEAVDDGGSAKETRGEALPQEEEMDEEAFLKAKELADLSYSPGFLTRFAERRGALTNERIDAIANFVFPARIYDAAKSINKAFDIDLASVTQAMTALSCQTIRGSRFLYMGGGRADIMPSSLFLNVIGGPTSGKSLLANCLLYAVEDAQYEAFEEYQKKFSEYLEKKLNTTGRRGKMLKSPSCLSFAAFSPMTPLSRHCWIGLRIILKVFCGTPMRARDRLPWARTGTTPREAPMR